MTIIPNYAYIKIPTHNIATKKHTSTSKLTIKNEIKIYTEHRTITHTHITMQIIGNTFGPT
jgi:hypothetical protein